MDLELPQAGVPLTNDPPRLMAEAWYRAFSGLYSQFRDLTRDVTDGLENAETGLGTKATKAQTEYGCWPFIFPADGTETVCLNLPFGWTITKTTTKTRVGTSTVTVKINGVALGGSDNAASTSEQEQAHSSANVAAAGDDITVTFASTSGDCEGLALAIQGTRTLD